MSRPYLYHYVKSFSRSLDLSREIARKELDKAGFENPSKPMAWEQFAYNGDTLVVVTCVPLSSSKTYVHVVATANSDAPAKHWASDLMEKIEESKLTLID